VNTTPKKRPQNRRSFRSRKLSDALSRLSDPLLRKRGFAVREIVTRWPAIVGEQLAAQSCPEKLVFPPEAGDNATLHIRVDGPLALELQHLSPLIVERVNTYYGFNAVSRLTLHQAPLPPHNRPTIREVRALTGAERQELDDTLAPVQNPELKQTLAALGHSILASGGAKPE
jgi:hypothetical protein